MYGKINRGPVICPLPRGCPLFRGSVVRGFMYTQCATLTLPLRITHKTYSKVSHYDCKAGWCAGKKASTHADLVLRSWWN